MTRRSIGTSYRRSSMSTIAQLVTGVDFVALPTHDVEKAAEFYGETLGLRRSVYMPERHFAEFETGNLTLSVIDAEGMGLEHHVQHHEVALHVEDVHAARSLLEERGVQFRGQTLDTGVCHMAFFNDPDGNGLMLHNRYAPRSTEA
jgi:predicted enzyme related to lactoylglutathione lyase